MIKDTWCKEFSVPTYEQWRAAAEKSLKGAAFEAKLLTKTYEGITLQPIYREEDIEKLPHLADLPGVAPYVRGTKASGAKSWEVCQEILASRPEEFNRAAKHDLERGLTMLHLVLDRAARAGLDPDEAPQEDIGGTGVSIFRREDLDAAFSEMNLEEVPLYLHTGTIGSPKLALLLAYFEANGLDASKLRGCVAADPVGIWVTEGKLSHSLQSAFADMAQTTRWAVNHAYQLKTILVQAHPYHDAGGNAVQELAFSLATGVEYIRAMLDRGLSMEEIAPKIQFSYSVGSNVFMEIAKLRAARMLWSTIIESFGGSADAQKMTVHARTSAWTKTVLDPNVNLLRATTEAFSAIIGGVDSLHVSAFDEAIRPANDFSRRIARNTQIILEQEAHLAKVADPAGGSWYVEWLTDAIAQKAWELFQQVEEQGGMIRALESGYPQEQIEQMAKQKADDISHRKSRVVGTNMYANVQEQPVQAEKLPCIQEEQNASLQSYRSMQDPVVVAEAIHQLANAIGSEHVLEIAVKAALAGATLGDLTKAIVHPNPEPITVQPLRLHRGAEIFESLRKQADLHREKTGSRPKVFLANMGPISKHKARADFAAEFFAVGGFDIVRDQSFASVEEAAQAAASSGAPITVICSDDESYPELVPPLALAIKDKNQQMTVLLAGLPAADRADEYKTAGVDDCIHVRTNCCQMLRDLQRRIGVLS